MTVTDAARRGGRWLGKARTQANSAGTLFLRVMNVNPERTRISLYSSKQMLCVRFFLYPSYLFCRNYCLHWKVLVLINFSCRVICNKIFYFLFTIYRNNSQSINFIGV
jgi:hypothetical protein